MATFFLLLGLIIAVYSLLVSTSVLSQSEALIDDMRTRHQLIGNRIVITVDNEKDWSSVLSSLEQSDGNAIAILVNGILFTDKASTMIQAVWCQGQETDYPLIEGRNFSAEDFHSNKYVVLAGNQLNSVENGKLSVDGVTYTVVGKMGIPETTRDNYCHKLIFTLPTIPPSVKKSILTAGYAIVDVYKMDKEFESSFAANLEEMGLGFERIPVPGVEYSRTSDYEAIGFSILIYLMMLLNTMNLSLFWIRSRRKEIAIRRSFGFNQEDIILMIVKENIELCIIASCLAMFLLFTTKPILWVMAGIAPRIEYLTLFAVIAFIVFTSLVASILPTIWAIRQDPIQSLRE